MKSYKHVYPQIYALENLLAAFYQVRRGKPKTPELGALEFQLEANMFALTCI